MLCRGGGGVRSCCQDCDRIGLKKRFSAAGKPSEESLLHRRSFHSPGKVIGEICKRRLPLQNLKRGAVAICGEGDNSWSPPVGVVRGTKSGQLNYASRWYTD